MTEQPEDPFTLARPWLLRIAYRMLGSVGDAEGVVQESYLRFQDQAPGSILNPGAFLRRVVIRLCLDHLKSARRTREIYVGTWLPEPVVEPAEGEVDDFVMPLLLALERLTPLERAAFLLHDIFGVAFDEVAATIRREPAACRQLARRARESVRADRPRFPVARARGLELAAAFFAASRNGELDRLQSLLSEDVVVYSDGGGKASSLEHPCAGLQPALELFASLQPLFAECPSTLVRYAFVNGLPGFVTREAGGLLQTTGLEVDGDRIRRIYVTRNPDKVRHLDRSSP
ncbi:RNA polymerase sigma factor SigJ [Geothrix sp. 21YS21S-4]|uniref:RNA polymerase sigma factor SigJ n=1 Tax=Geothrix sp. 21YS21S-4 TaxID=3068889 RepID=UPI0027BA478B|nr:RNA polymerase sigma factor SigJ [Geothrix sp. 21YS21S-4]